MVLHFLSDLVPFVDALVQLGAAYRDIYLVAKPYPYSRRDRVSHDLQRRGVRVYRASPSKNVAEVAKKLLSELLTDSTLENKRIVVIEDGGYFAPLLHLPDFSALLDRCDGIVEQTTKGIREDEKISNVRTAILSVAGSEFKAQYESPEIGRVTVQNISRFVPNVKLSGRHALLFGFGAVGEHVAYHLNRSFNMGVCVIDIDNFKRLKAMHRKDIVSQVYSSFAELPAVAVKLIRLVVGTTGRTSITREILEQLPEGSILVSTSSDQVEIDMKALAEMAGANCVEIEEGKTEYTFAVNGVTKTFTVLAEGYPINFYASESLPNDSIDPIMTFLLLCGVDVCQTNRPPGILPQAVIQGIEKEHNLIGEFLKRC